jgi:PQQ-dependent dehydrogenase (methanol/ethanol family)
VYALDLSKPGAPMIWKHVPNQSPDAIPIACCDLVNRGTAYHPSGKIFIQLLQGELLALDAKSGKELWKVKNADYKQGSTMTNAPIVIKDIVIAGISGGEFGVRGRVTAYNVNDGKEVWRGYSTGPDSEVLIQGDANPNYPSHKGKDLGVSTWQGDEWKRGGGTTWGWYSYDPELNLFYYSTGNPGSWNPDQRPGDNKWSMTIFARNPDNGQVKWAYQMTPHDEWDYDGVNENVLFESGGKKLLAHFDRNGFGYTLDRTNGKVLVAQPYGPVNWAKRVDLTTGVPERDPRYGTTAKKNTEGICPAAIGFKDQQPAAYSPMTGLFYVPANHICMDYEGVEVKYTAGQPYVGAIVRMFPGPGGHRGNFIAWDPMKGKAVWQNKENLAAYGGALTTAGGLVFYGTMEGWLKALDQKTGKELWRYKTPSGIIGNPMTYNGPDGQQYVAVYSGIGGWAGIGVAAGIGAEDPTAGLGALGAFGDAGNFSNQGGVMTVFSLKNPWPAGK